MNVVKVSIALLSAGGSSVALFAIKDTPRWLKAAVFVMTAATVMHVLPELPRALSGLERAVAKVRSWTSPATGYAAARGRDQATDTEPSRRQIWQTRNRHPLPAQR